MLAGLLEGIITAWLLVQFGIDGICIEILQPFIKQELTTRHFYFVLGLTGLLVGCIRQIVRS